MEKIAVVLIPALLTLGLVKALLTPMGQLCKLALHCGCGFLCLWLLNGAAAFTGVLLPVNAVTVLTAGILGIPGIGIIALLTLL